MIFTNFIDLFWKIHFVLLFIKKLKSEIMQTVNFIVGAQFFTIWIFHPLKITSM